MKILSLILGVCLVAFTAFMAPTSQQKEFQAFLSNIEEIEFPFEVQQTDLTDRYKEIDQMSTDDFDRGARLAKKYRRFIPELETRFSRMGPPMVKPLATIEVSNDIVGVLYTCYHFNRYFGDNTYRLMLYDRQGNPIDYREEELIKDQKKDPFFSERRLEGFLLAHHNSNETQIFTLAEGGEITTQKFENIWEQDKDEFGIIDNKVVGYSPTTREVHKLTRKGKIIKKVNSGIDKTARASIH